MIKYELSDESKKYLDGWNFHEFINPDRFGDDQKNRLKTISESAKALANVILTTTAASKQRDIVMNQCKSIVFLCGSAILSTEGNLRKDKVG